MHKRLLWILFGLVALATAIFALRFARPPDNFSRLTTLGAGYLDKGDATNAVNCFSQALALAPESIDTHLNLANAYLLAENLQEASDQCQQVLTLDHNNAAAYYLLGCAYLRMNKPEQAVQVFQQSQRIDPAVTALNFQLGLAQERLGHLEEAIHEFETVVQFEPGHVSAHYQLSRLYQRVGRATEAGQELAKHEQIRAKNPTQANSPVAFERCKYTQPRLAMFLEQPSRRGVSVRFVDATASAFGQQSSLYHGPIGVLDYNHDGRNSLLVMQGDGFRLLNNSRGQFAPLGEVLPGAPGNSYSRCLVGDLNNDRFEDVVVLGEQASHVLRFATNGQFREITAAAGMKELKGRDGVLADLDFTGKLDLLAVLPGGQGLRLWRNLGNAYFRDATTNSGLAPFLPGVEHLFVEDWNNEDVPGVFVTRTGRPPLFFSKQRAGSFVETNVTADWPSGSIIAIGDFNNDRLLDYALADDRAIHIGFGGTKQRLQLPLNGLRVTGLLLVDYDNDGWLDLLAYGNGLRVWRNLGKEGFQDVTATLGVDKVGQVESVVAADFDGDGDTDLVLSSANGLRFLRNDGGNANHQLKLRLVGNRSNASSLGARVELAAGHWRAIRTLHQLPLEIGVAQHDKIDVLKVRWFDLATTLVDLSVNSQPVIVPELMLPTGSCPYLYAWDGHRFKFVTDILGSSPLGLPVSQTRFVEADPEEFLALGNDQQFPAKGDSYELRVTEELREVLYLDQTRLFVVDHPPGTLVLPTSKMRPAQPFPPHQLWTLRRLASPKDAVRSDGLNLTKALAEMDEVMVSPIRLREPQLRGLAEPFSITLDFGPLRTDGPLVLLMNGWLRFGGGMANIAASLDPTLPFPFPNLEVELPDGSWKSVQTDVGVPAGKTKTILVDLENKLPPGARRLRWTTAFEIYWDCIWLCEKVGADSNTGPFSRLQQVSQRPAKVDVGTAESVSSPKDPIIYTLAPDQADLHWRGFSEFAPLPEWLPLTPVYDTVQFTPPWRRTPAGWCTRYGPVKELVSEKDNALVLLNGGDELALSFKASRLPPKPAGFVRDFFLNVVGWDKDADFHVNQGWRVEPLPFLGLDSQAYGRQARPPDLNDSWITKYNTRWVGPMVLSQERR